MAAPFELMLLIGIALALGTPFLRREGHLLPNGGSILVAIAFGLALLSLVTAIAWHLGILPQRAIPLVALLAILFAGLEGWRGHRAGEIASSVPCSIALASSLVSALLMIIYAFPILYAAAWMGSGSAPPVFFNNDSAFYLGHVQALARFDAFPPPSLNVVGVVQPYHYGIQLTAALFSRWANVAPHVALFWIVTPLFLSAKLAVVWRLGTLAASRGVPHWLAVLVLLFFVEYPTYAVDIPRFFHEPLAAWQRVIEVVLSPERFDTGFPLLSTLAGSFLVFLTALFMLDDSLPNRLAGLALSVACFALFKTPYVLPVEIWVCAWAAYQLATARTVMPLIAAACGGLLATALVSLTLRPGFAYAGELASSLRDEAWTETFVWRGVVPYAGLLLAAGGCLLLLQGRWSGRRIEWLFAEPLVFLATAAAITLLPLLIPVTYVSPSGKATLTVETLQWLTAARWIAALAVVAAACSAFSHLSPRRQLTFTAVVIVLVAMPVINKIRDGVYVVAAPAAWHEFVDNGPMINALASIPTEKSLIATNDLRYPANNYSRDRRQLQIGALFGHQAYAAVTKLDHAADEDLRVEEQMLLRLPSWNEGLSAIACKRGWTHIVIHKTIPHVQSIPGKVLYDGDEYTTVALPRCR